MQLSSEWCDAGLWQKNTVWTLSVKMKSVRLLCGSLSACLSQFINVMATDCLEGFTNMIYCCVYPCLGVAVCV